MKTRYHYRRVSPSKLETAKGCLRKDSQISEGQLQHERELEQLLREILDTNHGLPRRLYRQFLNETLRLHQIFVAQQHEEVSSQDGMSTSSPCDEMVVAQCISGCLQDSCEPKPDTSLVQGLVADYGAVVALPGKTPSVSLRRIHSMLQDNFQGSSLCKLFDHLLMGGHKFDTKVIYV